MESIGDLRRGGRNVVAVFAAIERVLPGLVRPDDVAYILMLNFAAGSCRSGEARGAAPPASGSGRFAGRLPQRVWKSAIVGIGFRFLQNEF